eukprot:18428-Pelagococcus_subviridis.AAC.1
MPRGHDVVDVAPNVLLRQRIPLRVLRAQQDVQEAVVLVVPNARINLQLRPALVDDVIDPFLEDRVPFLELPDAADAENVLQLQKRHRRDEQLAHDLARVVVRVEHRADLAVVRPGAAVQLRVDPLYLLEVLVERERGDDVEREPLRVVVDVDLYGSFHTKRCRGGVER